MLYFNFHNNEDLLAFSISTCECQVDISALINAEEGAFMAAFQSVMVETKQDFNMAWLKLIHMYFDWCVFQQGDHGL